MQLTGAEVLGDKIQTSVSNFPDFGEAKRCLYAVTLFPPMLTGEHERS